MLNKNFKLSLRYLQKNRIYTLVNTLGLSLGLTAAILIGLYLRNELSYDKHIPDGDRIYRVAQTSKFAGTEERSASCPAILGETLAKKYPQLIEYQTRLYNDWAGEFFVEYMPSDSPFKNSGSKQFREKRLLMADSTFFQIFPAKAIAGDFKKALSSPLSIVLTESTAKRYFGNANALGKQLRLNKFMKLTVTGVVEDPPVTTHMPYDMIVSLSTMARFSKSGTLPQTWVFNPFYTYVKLKPGVSKDELEAQLPRFALEHYFDADPKAITLTLQPLTSIHLHSNLDYELSPNSNWFYLKWLAYIALFVIVVAAINYMNLSTATAVQRAKEIALKKVFGANKNFLRAQFLTEAFIMVLVATFLALLFSNLMLPLLNSLASRRFTALDLMDPTLLMVLAGIVLGTALLAGSYPALFLTGYEPVKVLRGLTGRGRSPIIVRKVLVVFQIAASFVLIVITAIFIGQLSFIRNADLGFDSKNIILVPIKQSPLVKQFQVFRTSLLENAMIESVSAVDEVPGVNHNNHEFKVEGEDPNKWHFFPALVIRDDFIKTLRIPIVSGRDFIYKGSTDYDQGLLISEDLVRQMGWTNESAIGKSFHSLSGHERVVGVFKDFHVKSLHQPITPLVLNLKENEFEINYFTRYVIVRYRSDASLSVVLNFIKQKYIEMNEGRPFEYSLLTDEIEKQYAAEKKTSEISALLCLLMLLVAAMGLIGLVSYVAGERAHEIGIRKVLGASDLDILSIIGKEFAILTLFAIVIGIPLAAIFAHWWLSGFSYAMPINPNVYLIATMIIALITFAITAVHAVLISRKSPLLSIRNNS